MQLFTGKEYLKIDIASNFGLDKKKWNERIAWFDAHESKLEEMLTQAAEPALFFAGVQAWRATQAGAPSGYPISLDATSSGLQLLACLTGDRSAAQLCNVVNHIGTDGMPQRMDAYTAIYEAMLALVGSTAKVTRDMAKDAIMTALYGSKAVPKKVFGEGNLLTVFYDTMSTLAPAAWELNEAMVTMWDSTTSCHSWVLPDNFHVHVKVMSQRAETVHFLEEPFEVYHHVNAPMDEGRSLGANTIHSVDGMVVREMTRRCDYDRDRIDMVRDLCQDIVDGRYTPLQADEESPDFQMCEILWDHYLQTGYLSARILDHVSLNTVRAVDAQVILELIESMPVKPFKVISIHDCFRCLPNYANDLRKQYNLQLMLIAKSTILGSLISQLVKKAVTIGKLDSQLWKDISDTEYALS
jgi:hypothetical protein